MTYLGTRPSKLEYNNEGYVVYKLCPVGDTNAEPTRYKDERESKAATNRPLNKMKEPVKKNDMLLNNLYIF